MSYSLISFKIPGELKLKKVELYMKFHIIFQIFYASFWLSSRHFIREFTVNCLLSIAEFFHMI